jgi:hypothetical protein
VEVTGNAAWSDGLWGIPSTRLLALTDIAILVSGFSRNSILWVALRFVLQPVVSTVLAVRDGVKDARWFCRKLFGYRLSGIGGSLLSLPSMISDAQARVGRPLTPGSVAGVARRTTRRVVRRSTIYVATLPASCVRVVIDGISYSQCGGTYYQPYGGRYVVVYIN